MRERYVVLSVLYVTLLSMVTWNVIFCQMQNGPPITISLKAYNELEKNATSDKIYETMTTIAPSTIQSFYVSDLPILPKSFLIIQAHTFRYNVSLSYTDFALQPHMYINGTNVGLYFLNNKKEIPFWIFNSNAENVTTLIAVIIYKNNVPVPGGCNLEFNTEIAPYLKLTSTDSVITVDGEAASISNASCDKQKIQYDTYHLYLPEQDFTPETYFNGIRQLMTVSNILESGHKVPTPLNSPYLRRKYSAYHGLGEVFAMIATYNNQTSAYVPIVSYSCDILQWSNYCEDITSPLLQTLNGIIFFLGIFGCYFGHKFFKTGVFLLGLFTGSLVSYILISIAENDSLESNILSSLLIGIASGLVWLSVWSYFGIPIVAVTLPNLVVGFVLASVFYYAGLADFQLMQFDVNYWMVFISIILSTSMSLSIITQHANILACSVLGAYCVIIPIDRYIGANLKYILINVLRRAIEPEFQNAIIDPPFQNRDIALFILWAALAISGYGYQYYQQKGRPPFPPPPYMQRRLEVHLQRSEREPLVTNRGSVKPYQAILTTPSGSQIDI